MGSRNAADSALCRSAKVSSFLPPQKDDWRGYPLIIRWEMRCGMPHAGGAQPEMQLSTFWTPRCEHLGRLSTSFTTLEAAGTGISERNLVLQVNGN